MKAQKGSSSKKGKLPRESEESDLVEKLKDFGDRLSQLESREFWHSHLPWPKFLRKPRIRFIAPRISGAIPIPNRSIMFVIALFLVAFSLAGGTYAIISKSVGRIAIGYDTSTDPATPIFFYQGLHDQFLLEGIIAVSIIMLGMVGFLFIHQSTKHFYRPKYSYLLFSVGIALLFFSFISMTVIVEYGKGINMYNPFG